jgi:hypothetical protein
MTVLLGSVLEPDEHGAPANIGFIGDVITLAGARTDRNLSGSEMVPQGASERCGKIAIAATTQRRTMEGSRPITFPVVDVSTAHST